MTDAQKAFDIVWHAGLMREMNKIGMSDDNWLLFQQWYKSLSSKNKMAKDDVEDDYREAR